jgi:hypothetical protein
MFLKDTFISVVTIRFSKRETAIYGPALKYLSDRFVLPEEPKNISAIAQYS